MSKISNKKKIHDHVINNKAEEQLTYAQRETPINGFTMTGWINYSDNAGFHRQHLHNRMFDRNKNMIMHLRNVGVCSLMDLC